MLNNKNILGTGIVTMAGRSQRFLDVGYKVPKHHLRAFDQSLFYWSVRSCYPFYSNGYEMLFVTNKQHGDEKKFVEEHLSILQIKNARIIEVDDYTDGQATTALLADGSIADKTKPVFIMNIDTMIEPSVMYDIFELSLDKSVHGIIPSCRLAGNQWSFVRTNDQRVTVIAEKIRISDLATLGFYWFDSFANYRDLYKQTFSDAYIERYVSSMYQTALENNSLLLAPEIDLNFVKCFGTPEQYTSFLLS